MSRSVHLLVFEGLADWEPAYALTGVRHWAKMPVRTVGFDKSEVTTMGGLRVTPDTALEQIDPEHVALFMLPGGDMWEGDYPSAALGSALETLQQRNVPIAGICAATIALARAGLFVGRRHTSNGREYLRQHAGDYSGADKYVDTLATRDAGVVSASGLGALEFAREIFRELNAFTEAEIVDWYDMYRSGRLPA